TASPASSTDMAPSKYFPLPLNLQLQDHGRSATLLEPFVFIEWEDAAEPRTVIRVPSGFQTDFNSTPRGTWNVFPPWKYPEAAVIHDYLYRHPDIHQRGEADRIHRKVMELSGASWGLRWTAWAA